MLDDNRYEEREYDQLRENAESHNKWLEEVQRDHDCLTVPRWEGQEARHKQLHPDCEYLMCLKRQCEQYDRWNGRCNG